MKKTIKVLFYTSAAVVGSKRGHHHPHFASLPDIDGNPLGVISISGAFT